VLHACRIQQCWSIFDPNIRAAERTVGRRRPEAEGLCSMTANWFAYFALLAWTLVALFLYRTQPVAKATILTILSGYLLLPEVAIKLTMIPALDKNSIPAICALMGCSLLSDRRRARYSFGAVDIVAIVYVTSPLLTSALNNDPVAIGSTVIPGVDYYDGISTILGQALFFLPFFIGRFYLRTPSDNENTLRLLATSGLLYSLPMLFEIRMSPQLSSWIYGYFPSSFSTEGRYGGFRPVVFMRNGLVLAFFMMTSLLASISIWRSRVSGKQTLSFAASSAYLAIILVLCKSLGSLVYGAVAGPLIGWIRPRLIVRIATLLVSISLIYPLLRIEQIFPDRWLVSIAQMLSEERANSLLTRFGQEEELLERSSQRPIFGWGRFGRSRVYDETGKDVSLTDGQWIITLGQFGIVGFLAQFGLFVLPVFRAARSLKFAASPQHALFLSTLSLIVALGLVEQLPNSSLSAWNWLLAGSLLGTAEQLRKTSLQTKSGRRSTEKIFSFQPQVNSLTVDDHTSVLHPGTQTSLGST
jgi:hypothetical protein